MVAKNSQKTAPETKKETQKKVQKTIKKDGGDKKERSGVVDKDFEVDEMERYTGECVFYDKKRGFGFVKLDNEGVVPEDKVMVYWREIKSDDRWPFLHKTLKVEFQLKKRKTGKDEFQIIGCQVSAPGGDALNLQDEADAKKEFVGDKNMRFLGNVKWFDFKKGFGYVNLQEGYAIDEGVPTEFRIDRNEINSGEEAPMLSDKMEIEFGIQKSEKGVYSCYHVTLPGGETISRAIAEGRKDLSKSSFKGTIQFWSWKNGMGFVVPENAEKLPKEYKEALKADKEKRDKKASKNGKDASDDAAVYFGRNDKVGEDGFKKGDSVTFKLYLDNKGIGACEVTKA